MTTKAEVTIYISAASDLMAEREALARMIAALPVKLAWRILQTPLTEVDHLDLEALESADLYLLLMSSDIRAPVGLEWLMARRAGQSAITFLKRGVLRTPAAQVFINDVGTAWRFFQDAADLSHQVQILLAEHLLHHAVRYSLTPAEVAELEALPTSGTVPEHISKGQEAAHSAVILSRERYEPSGGVVVDDEK
ncbi:MAG: hypothetical protein Kow0063_10870 [Anaerolineae bacterium]